MNLPARKTVTKGKRYQQKLNEFENQKSLRKVKTYCQKLDESVWKPEITEKRHKLLAVAERVAATKSLTGYNYCQKLYGSGNQK